MRAASRPSADVAGQLRIYDRPGFTGRIVEEVGFPSRLRMGRVEIGETGRIYALVSPQASYLVALEP